jgi:chaperonin GroEL (HSP60 family)
MVLKRVKNSDMEALRRITGANLVSNLKELLPHDLGSAESVLEKKFGEYPCVCVSDSRAKSVTAILRGATGHTVDELERAFDDVIGVVTLSEESKIMVAGGGSAYAHLARVLRNKASDAPGRQAMAVESFANALESIPWTLAENAGVDPVDAILELKGAGVNDGISIDGDVKDMRELSVVEPRRIIRTAISSAVEASTLILRI